MDGWVEQRIERGARFIDLVLVVGLFEVIDGCVRDICPCKPSLRALLLVCYLLVVFNRKLRAFNSVVAISLSGPLISPRRGAAPVGAPIRTQ